MSATVPVVEQHHLLRANISVEEGRNPEGQTIYTLHFDVLKGNIAERTSVTFDESGFDAMIAQCQGIRSGLTLATQLPRALEPLQ